uniref:Flap endonuclease n=1 Tax=Pithovirus LCPAC403 TaxID=2506596 RepID=A0A481ZAI9_9VIRU|nr:MAG: flap endonuclease [Pithovirus LCPAC403]
MGIKDFSKLTKEIPGSRILVNPSYISRTKIAIDAMVFMWSYYCMSVDRSFYHMSVLEEEVDRDDIRKEFLEKMATGINKLLKLKVTPIFVFDGIHRIEKSETTKSRTERREKSENQSNILLNEYKERIEIDGIETEIEVEIIPYETDEVKQKLVIEEVEQTRKMTKDEKETYKKKIETKLKQCVTIKKDDIMALRRLLEAIGIPSITALNDGEELCASMCRERKVFAAYTTDTDVLAFGSPTQMISVKKNELEIVILDVILKERNWTMDEFVDFCITLSCDFNSRIKKIGPARALILIDKYRSIDNYPSHLGKIKLDTSVLNHETCREIFRPKSSVELCVEGLTDDELSNLKIDKTKLKTCQDVLEELELSGWEDTLSDLYEDLGEPISTLVDGF